MATLHFLFLFQLFLSQTTDISKFLGQEKLI